MWNSGRGGEGQNPIYENGRLPSASLRDHGSCLHPPTRGCLNPHPTPIFSPPCPCLCHPAQAPRLHRSASRAVWSGELLLQTTIEPGKGKRWMSAMAGPIAPAWLEAGTMKVIFRLIRPSRANAEPLQQRWGIAAHPPRPDAQLGLAGAPLCRSAPGFTPEADCVGPPASWSTGQRRLGLPLGPAWAAGARN